MTEIVKRSAAMTPRFKHCGETAVSVELGDTIDLETNRRVRQLFHKLQENPLHGILSMNPTYRSLFIQYDPWECSFEKLIQHLENMFRQGSGEPVEGRTLEIPVCYGGEFGPDLAFVASHNGLSVKEVIRIHSASLYPVFMIGFTPGFPYLGGLDSRLFTPRRDTPRIRVPAGSVGIADQQTGIYSLESPGGWQIIGRSPLKFFDPQEDPPALLRAGMNIRFRPINKDEYSLT